MTCAMPLIPIEVSFVVMVTPTRLASSDPANTLTLPPRRLNPAYDLLYAYISSRRSILALMREIGEGELRREQELQADPVDRLDLELAAEAFHPGVAIDVAGDAERRERNAVAFDDGVDLGAAGGGGEHEGQKLDRVA